MRLCSFVLASIATLILGGAARADFLFEFATVSGSTTTFGNAFTVGTGQTLTLEVFLAQTNGPTLNSTNLTANGLSQGGVAMTYSTSAPFSINSTSNITPGANFGGTSNPSNNETLNTSGGKTTAGLQVYSTTPVFPGTPATDPSGNAVILLGSFTFTGNSVGSATTSSALPSSVANNIDGAGNNLDSLIQNSSAAITVVAVPEPGTLILTGLLASGIAGGYIRKRRRLMCA